MTKTQKGPRKARINIKADFSKLKLPKALTDLLKNPNLRLRLDPKWVTTILQQSQALETQMKDFVARLQKDLGRLQKTLEQEGNDLVKKVKTAATSKKIVARGKHLEKLVEQKLRKLEPTMDKVLANIRKEAKKAGVDLDALTKNAKSRFHKAKVKATKAKARVLSKPRKATKPRKTTTSRSVTVDTTATEVQASPASTTTTRLN